MQNLLLCLLNDRNKIWPANITDEASDRGVRNISSDPRSAMIKKMLEYRALDGEAQLCWEDAERWQMLKFQMGSGNFWFECGNNIVFAVRHVNCDRKLRSSSEWPKAMIVIVVSKADRSKRKFHTVPVPQERVDATSLSTMFDAIVEAAEDVAQLPECPVCYEATRAEDWFQMSHCPHSICIQCVQRLKRSEPSYMSCAKIVCPQCRKLSDFWM
jgi:hypothetical protein